MFKRTEWNERPAAAKRLKDGRYMITRKVEEEHRDDAVIYVGEIAFMSETQYAAYLGASEVAERTAAEIIDDYTMELIEGGVL